MQLSTVKHGFSPFIWNRSGSIITVALIGYNIEATALIGYNSQAVALIGYNINFLKIMPYLFKWTKIYIHNQLLFVTNKKNDNLHEHDTLY